MTTAPSSEPLRAAVVTVSSSRARDGGSDESGDALVAFVSELGGTLSGRDLVGDDREEIERCLRRWSNEGCDLILTTGGTGFAAADVTPEATEAVIERRAPGIAEAMRAASRPHTAHWMLSRGVAGTRGRTLIVNFPGSPRSIGQCGEAIATALPHALALLAGERPAHRR